MPLQNLRSAVKQTLASRKACRFSTSAEGRQYTQKLEQELQNLNIVQELRALTVKPDGSDGDWYETPHGINGMHDIQALLNLPSKIGVTATLNVQYKKPTKADQASPSVSFYQK
ncbi:hypothetical protein QFC19_008078 [Naganishia cerealis]|uniref:Uncharacterized protein n=1 Tax=Naganishia cerealis TaxID=610337 RepID=A0ACC2V5J2_9TREE|nr:hypothetical protein QFC19_008078 [Naganishia cerealis]